MYIKYLKIRREKGRWYISFSDRRDAGTHTSNMSLFKAFKLLLK